MIRFAAMAILLAAAWAAAGTKNSNSTALGVVVADSVEDNLATNPAIAFAQEMERDYLRATKLLHTFGRPSGGDRLIFSKKSPTIRYIQMRNAKTTQRFPDWGIGPVITFIDIKVEQVREVFQ